MVSLVENGKDVYVKHTYTPRMKRVYDDTITYVATMRRFDDIQNLQM
jgi:hypothetical protein